MASDRYQHLQYCTALICICVLSLMPQRYSAGASVVALKSCPGISVTEGLSQFFCLLRYSLCLSFSSFKEAVHLLHTSERLRQSVWKNGDKKALTMSIRFSVCLCLHLQNLFLPIKHTLISITMPELRSWGAEGLRGFRSLSLQHAEQTRLLCT